jgi:hypothetical protein
MYVEGNTLAVDKNKEIRRVGIYRLIYPARNSHTPYYIAIWGLSGSTILYHTKILNIKCFMQFFSSNFTSKNNSATDYTYILNYSVFI